MSACAGGGSFDTLEVSPEPPPLPEPPKVNKVPEPRQSPEEQAELKKPALGYVIKGLRRNTARFDKEGNELLDKDGQPTQAELEAKLNIPKGIEEVTDNELSIPKLAEMQSDPNNGGKRVYTPERKQKDKYHYIRFGHTSVEYPKIIMNGVPYRQHEYRTGHNVNTFYRGIHSAPTLPSGNNVEYIGEWAFLSDVKKNKGKFSVRPDQIPGNSFNGFNR